MTNDLYFQTKLSSCNVRKRSRTEVAVRRLEIVEEVAEFVDADRAVIVDVDAALVDRRRQWLVRVERRRRLAEQEEENSA